MPKGSAEMVLAAISTIFDQPDAVAVREQLERDRRQASDRAGHEEHSGDSEAVSHRWSPGGVPLRRLGSRPAP